MCLATCLNLSLLGNMSIDSDKVGNLSRRLFHVTGVDTVKSRRPTVALVYSAVH